MADYSPFTAEHFLLWVKAGAEKGKMLPTGTQSNKLILYVEEQAEDLSIQGKEQGYVLLFIGNLYQCRSPKAYTPLACCLEPFTGMSSFDALRHHLNNLGFYNNF